MGYTSINLPKLVIDTDKVAASGDFMRFPECNINQQFGTFSTGMFQEQQDIVIVDEGGPGQFELPRGGRVPFAVGANGELPAEFRIPESEYEARIKELEEMQADIRSRSTFANLICKDQNGTNYCWANSPTYCYEICRVYMNAPLIYFSPGSIAGPVNGYTNSGGWGGSALKRMVSNGVAPVSLYPANQVRKPSNFDAAMEIAALNKTLEWWTLRDRNMQDVVSCLLRGWPVAAGLNWWSHEVTYTRALWIDGALCIEFRNSWGMSYGDMGYGILKGSKMLPDDAVTPRVPSIYMSEGAHAMNTAI